MIFHCSHRQPPKPLQAAYKNKNSPSDSTREGLILPTTRPKAALGFELSPSTSPLSDSSSDDESTSTAKMSIKLQTLNIPPWYNPRRIHHWLEHGSLANWFILVTFLLLLH